VCRFLKKTKTFKHFRRPVACFFFHYDRNIFIVSVCCILMQSPVASCLDECKFGLNDGVNKALITLDTIELPRRLRVILCVLASDGKTHGVPLSNITANHSLVCNVLPNLGSQLALNL